MAYINGKEILFSPNINITVSDGAGGSYTLTEADIQKIAEALLDNLIIDNKVEQDSQNLITSGAVHNEFTRFSIAYDQIIDEHKDEAVSEANEYTDEKITNIVSLLQQIEDKRQAVSNGATITVADNTSYYALAPINNLTIVYPSSDFICHLKFTVGVDDNGNYNIALPIDSKYIGKTPDFQVGETWELSIHNGVVVGGKVE